MGRRKKILKLLLGVLIGFVASNFNTLTTFSEPPCASSQITPYRLIEEEDARASNKNLIFVGVMTAAKYLDTRAKAVYDTWGREVPGKVMFFSSEFSYSEHVPLVPLAGVDDSYPPQKKSFLMLKYMYEHYIDQYEWFVRADDDVYVRTDKLEELLRSVDSRKPWFIGQTGRGNNEEFGQLSLDNDENFCMGGPGVIMSRETLKSVAPFAEQCLHQLYTTHEDVELGRCVRRFAGISCTWSYEMQVILYHNQSGEAAFSGDLKQKEVHRAITLHPVKQPHSMYRLHKYLKGLKVQKHLQENLLLHRDIAISMKELGHRISSLDKAQIVPDLPLFPIRRGSPGYLGDTNTLGVPTSLNRYTPHRLEDVLEWEMISKNLYSHRDLNPRRRIGSSLKEGLGDVVREIMELVNSYSKQRGRVIDFKDILYGYWRVNPVYGVDLILDLLLVYRKYRGHKMTVQVRRHAYVQQTFSGIFIREVDYRPNTTQSLVSTESLPVHKQIVNQLFSKITEQLQPIFSYHNSSTETLINFILPLSGRFNIFKRFMNMYEQVCLTDRENTRLFIVLFKNEDSPEDHRLSSELVRGLTTRYPDSPIRVVLSNETFSRGKALQLGVNELSEESLMLFIDVDMVFDKQSLQRIRRNTVLNKQVYFPIVYSLYNPGLLNRSYLGADYSEFTPDIINEQSGFWRQFGFGIVSLYKSDYLSLGGFNLMISGWGYEDVTFFDNAVRSNLKIFRVADPGLIHVFHSVKCDSRLDLSQKSMCLGTKASTLGSVSRLQDIFLKYKDLFR
nr:chondroitin sulfate synthase 1 [Leptinotarsa decemlineata]